MNLLFILWLTTWKAVYSNQRSAHEILASKNKSQTVSRKKKKESLSQTEVSRSTVAIESELSGGELIQQSPTCSSSNFLETSPSNVPRFPSSQPPSQFKIGSSYQQNTLENHCIFDENPQDSIASSTAPKRNQTREGQTELVNEWFHKIKHGYFAHVYCCDFLFPSDIKCSRCDDDFGMIRCKDCDFVRLCSKCDILEHHGKLHRRLAFNAAVCWKPIAPDEYMEGSCDDVSLQTKNIRPSGKFPLPNCVFCFSRMIPCKRSAPDKSIRIYRCNSVFDISAPLLKCHDKCIVGTVDPLCLTHSWGEITFEGIFCSSKYFPVLVPTGIDSCQIRAYVEISLLDDFFLHELLNPGTSLHSFSQILARKTNHASISSTSPNQDHLQQAARNYRLLDHDRKAFFSPSSRRCVAWYSQFFYYFFFNSYLFIFLKKKAATTLILWNIFFCIWIAETQVPPQSTAMVLITYLASKSQVLQTSDLAIF